MKKMKKLEMDIDERIEMLEELNDRMSELAVIDCVAAGEPFYIITGGKDCIGWTPMASKVRRLWMKAHPWKYWFYRLMNALGGGE